MYQLPSGEYSPQLIRPRTSIVPRLSVLMMIWLLLGACYAGYRFLSEPKRVAPIQSQATARPTVNPLVVAHATNANDAALRAETEIRQAEAEVRRTLALTDSPVETRHLHTALANLEAAHQGLEHSRYDIDSLESLLKGEDKP